MSSDVGNASRGRVEGTCNDNARDMVNGNHVHCVVNVGTAVDLNAAQAESDEEIVVVGNLMGQLVYRMDGVGAVKLTPVLESPRTYPERMIVVFKPLRLASLTRYSPAHLLWP